MKFEELPDDNYYNYKLTFEGDEIIAVAAAYREHIYYLAKKDQTEKINGADANIAIWSESAAAPWIAFKDPEAVLTILDKFIKRTAKAIRRIPGQTKVPPFISKQIPNRYLLGQVAIDLTNQIRNEFGATKVIKEVLDVSEQGEGEAAAEAT
jgi:hypothetical protein